MIVCHCRAVTDRQIRDDPDTLAGDCCGGCLDAVREIRADMADEEANSADHRNHAPARGLTTPAERVDYIVGLMECLEFRRGKTNDELAAVWGVSPSTVGNYSAEASRRVTADPDDAKRDISAGCRRLFKQAVDEGDAKSARAVGELWATVSGAKAAEKHQIIPPTEVTPQKARELMSDLFGSVTPGVLESTGEKP
jgi:bacterioferritin-associated ferredoxin